MKFKGMDINTHIPPSGIDSLCANAAEDRKSEVKLKEFDENKYYMK